MVIFAKLPRWAKPYFPIWEYQCPNCLAYLGYEPVNVCVKCGARFKLEEARIPPRFLKTKRGLHNYVHNTLLNERRSELEPWQIQFLDKHFSPSIFEDGFETGDFSAWTGTISDGVSFSVVSTRSHHGTYSGKITGDLDYNRGVIYKDFSSVSEVFARCYINLDKLPETEDRIFITSFKGSGAWNDFIMRVQIRNSAGTYYLEYLRDFPSSSTEGDVISVSTDTWHCIEQKFKRDASDGQYKIWWDGTLVKAETGLDTTGEQEIYAYELLLDVGASAPINAYYDCAVVDSAYIGPEVARRVMVRGDGLTWLVM